MINADKVILQSEDMRRVYINVLTEDAVHGKSIEAVIPGNLSFWKTEQKIEQVTGVSRVKYKDMCSTKITAYGKDFSFLQTLAYDDSAKLCIYGCGVNGEIICRYLKAFGRDIEYFVDRQADSREFTVLDRKVISPDTFLSLADGIRVIVSPDHQAPVIQYLTEKGIDEKNIICPFRKVDKEIRILEDNYEPKCYLKDSKRNRKEQADVIPEATIFTILYNTPKGMLCRTIESVLKQSFENFTYLIIDNGSTDASADTIRQYMKIDARITYIRLEKNVPWTEKGLLTKLKDNIKTTYVAMVDSDDYYEPDFLEKTISISRADASDMVQVNTLTYAHEGFRYSYFTHYFGRNICIEGDKKKNYFMLRILCVPVWGKLYKSDLFKELIDMMLDCETEYDRDCNFCLDISWMTYMALACNRVSLCDDLLHIRTWRPGSSEHSDNHSSKWLSSIVWSFEHLRKNDVEYEAAQVFEEAALMWLFSLPREEYSLSDFRIGDIDNKRVADFLNRPVCDKYRGNQHG